MTGNPALKKATASTLKWNTIDRLSSQVVFAAVGIVLANNLSREDFGIVGALYIFQAFATVFIDSGFGAALLRLKRAGKDDYSTVFWFNLSVSILLYLILWFATPSISEFFKVGERLVPYSKIMFLAFVINGLGIVQTNRLMKKMRVKKIAISNIAGLTLGGALGVYLAVRGAGAWALVWQTVSQAAIRTVWLWVSGKWLPAMVVSRRSFAKIWRVGLGVFSSSFLNTLFLYVYNFVIGGWYSISSLGVYTQADKWSKMGSASISQILTSSFVPLLARVQDNPDSFKRYVERINRFTAFISLPFLLGLATLATPLFHFLFGNKWDDAILLFQILAVRGVPVVLCSLLGNYLLALGYARSLVIIEIAKDSLLVGAILATVWSHSLPVMVWGQLAASLLTYIAVLLITCRRTGFSILFMTRGSLPFLFITLASCALAWIVISLAASFHPFLILSFGAIAGAGSYILMMRLLRIPELKEAFAALKGKLA